MYVRLIQLHGPDKAQPAPRLGHGFQRRNDLFADNIVEGRRHAVKVGRVVEVGDLDDARGIPGGIAEDKFGSQLNGFAGRQGYTDGIVATLATVPVPFTRK